MLRNELYQLLSLTESAGILEARVRLLPGSVIYAAHFPDMPITPGACLVQIASELFSEAAGADFDVAEASHIRFLNPVLPDRDGELSFRMGTADGSGSRPVEIFSGEVRCARMKLFLKKTE